MHTDTRNKDEFSPTLFLFLALYLSRSSIPPSDFKIDFGSDVSDD